MVGSWLDNIFYSNNLYCCEYSTIIDVFVETSMELIQADQVIKRYCICRTRHLGWMPGQALQTFSVKYELASNVLLPLLAPYIMTYMSEIHHKSVTCALTQLCHLSSLKYDATFDLTIRPDTLKLPKLDKVACAKYYYRPLACRTINLVRTVCMPTDNNCAINHVYILCWAQCCLPLITYLTGPAGHIRRLVNFHI